MKTSVLLSTDLLLLGLSSISIIHVYHLACVIALNLFIFIFLEYLKAFLALEDQDDTKSDAENHVLEEALMIIVMQEK